jgi:hypothetical protein
LATADPFERGMGRANCSALRISSGGTSDRQDDCIFFCFDLLRRVRRSARTATKNEIGRHHKKSMNHTIQDLFNMKAMEKPE